MNICEFVEGLRSIYGVGIKLSELSSEIEARGCRRDGELFLAHVWFSSFKTASGPRLAVVIWDASEDLRERDTASLDSLMSASHIALGAMAHEVRNLAAAARAIHEQMADRFGLAADPNFEGLGELIRGLEHLARSGLRAGVGRRQATVELRWLMDELRIIVEPSLRDAGIHLHWRVADELPLVEADQYGLLQVFLNLINNSRRAMETTPRRELIVEAFCTEGYAVARVSDTGTGVGSPEELFRPLQANADGTGLGLYLSRAMILSFGGELRFEPRPLGCAFQIRLKTVPRPKVAGRT